jgi:glycosyltransferase involved in cell wall biosynthesis
MIIAVNTRFLLKDQLEGYGYFIFETFRRITALHPEHKFIFIFDRPFDRRFIFSENITPVVSGPPARHPLLWKYWYDVKIPRLLKKYKADLFVSPDGYCSLNTKIPQCMVVHDLAFLHFPSHAKKSHLFYLKKYTPKFLEKAKTIATVSEFSKRDILDQYKIDPQKINVVYSAAKEKFAAVSEETKTETKIKYSSGHEYFLYVGAIHPRKNLLNLLKAFSVFKKRLKSNFKLILVGRLAWKYDQFLEKLKTYKYRDDVIMPGYIDEEDVVKLTASAYAVVYPSLWEGFGVPVLEAMNCNVPVLTSANSSMQEIASEAALYFDPTNHEDIAEKMMRIYKDEMLRNQLIEKGKSVTKNFSWDKTAALLWDCIQKTVV